MLYIGEGKESESESECDTSFSDGIMSVEARPAIPRGCDGNLMLVLVKDLVSVLISLMESSMPQVKIDSPIVTIPFIWLP